MTAAPSVTRTPASLTGAVPKPGRVLAVTTLGLALVLLNQSSVNVALPSMSGYFHAGAGTADWFLLSFMIATTASILVFGRISDLIGRKPLYLTGLSVFALASAACVFAPNSLTFIVIRVLQGIAGAVVITNSTALIADAFPADKLAGALGINLSAAAVANTVGPAIGGVLVTAFDWQAVFLVNLPFGIAAVVLGIRILPNPRRAVSDGPRDRFDYFGAALSALGLTALLFGVDRLSVADSSPVVVVVPLIAGVLLLAGFVVVETRVRHPLVDVALVKDWARGCAYGAAFFNSFSRAGVTLLVVLHAQIVGGSSPAEAGLVVMVMAFAMSVASPLAGRLASRVPARTVSSVGGVLLVIGLVGLALLLDGPTWVTTVLLAVVGVGIGLFTTPNTTSIMSGVAPDRRAVANAVRSVLYNSAQALGTTVSLLIVTVAGVASYAENTGSGAVQTGFAVALGATAVSAALAVVLSIARGGSWRTLD
ncbi:MFS transporter [Frondihabitans cladoniiphilus]|uniref:MFS transporter n=1 Tax=Frondihabitans cladoniiphilus TaxID=715785 RepID=A0ABP8VXR6_9MICO